MGAGEGQGGRKENEAEMHGRWMRFKTRVVLLTNRRRRGYEYKKRMKASVTLQRDTMTVPREMVETTTKEKWNEILYIQTGLVCCIEVST